jgi:hypothetical protein
LLLSSCFLLNTQGTISEAALQQLELVVKCTQRIRVDGVPGNDTNDADDGDSCGGGGGDDGGSGGGDGGSGGGGGDDGGDAASTALGRHFPHFMWVLRDFALQLKDEEQRVMSADSYLESCLRDRPGAGERVAAKNAVRRTLRAVFPHRSCETLVRPVLDERQLQVLPTLPESAMRGEFRSQTDALKRRLVAVAHPKSVAGAALTGAALVELARTYTQTLNSDRVPTILTVRRATVNLFVLFLLLLLLLR